MRGITNAVGGASDKNFLMKYNGVDQLILDLKGSPVNVSVGDYVYNEFNYTKLLGESIVTEIDKTTPIQVVNALYDTNDNGGNNLVRLDNGWLVCVLYDSSYGFRVYKFTNNDDWSELTGFNNPAYKNPSIVANGNIVTILTFFDSGGASSTVHSWTFDAENVASALPLSYKVVVDTSQTGVGKTSLASDSNGGLYAAWSSKNSPLPNPFNIRYSKSTDYGATWEPPTQITTQNTSAQQWTNPSIFIKNNLPIILVEYVASGVNDINTLSFDGSTWNIYFQKPYRDATYSQINPSVTVDLNGVIHAVWSGKDSTDVSINNIRYSKSEDDGANWSVVEKLTTGNTIAVNYPCITTDINNVVHIIYEDDTNDDIKRIYGSSGNWTTEIMIDEGVATNNFNVSVLDNYKNFEKPLIIYRDPASSDIKFYGKLTNEITPVQVIPPMSLTTNKTELQALYSNTLEMHNPNTDARYQGFVSKKDLWTSDLQELDWDSDNIKFDVNLFGNIGTFNPTKIESGSFSQSVVGYGVSYKTINLPFKASKIIIHNTFQNDSAGAAVTINSSVRGNYVNLGYNGGYVQAQMGQTVFGEDYVRIRLYNQSNVTQTPTVLWTAIE